MLVGAEKLRQPVADAFREKFGTELLEGYGCTEMSPVIAVNAPDFNAGKDSQTGNEGRDWDTRCPALPPALSIPSHSARCRPIRRVCCS